MPIFNKYKNLSDEALLSLISQGQEAAFNEIYARYARRMQGFFYQMLSQDNVRANDLCQELFIKLIEKNHLFNADKNFETWFFTLARNLCKNEYRRIGRLNKNMESWQQSEKRTSIEIERNLLGQMDQINFNAQLQSALEQLDFQARICFVLRYQEELAIREISEILDCPVGTVKSRLFYTLKKLADALVMYKNVPGA